MCVRDTHLHPLFAGSQVLLNTVIAVLLESFLSVIMQDRADMREAEGRVKLWESGAILAYLAAARSKSEKCEETFNFLS